MDPGITDDKDDEPLLTRTGRPKVPDPVTLDRAVRARIRRANGAAALWALVVAATIAGAGALFSWSDRLLVEMTTQDPRRRVWVAGSDRRRVLMRSYGPGSVGPYAIPLREQRGKAGR